MRESLLHALNIGTLALWLSVTGFGAVAIWVPRFAHEIAASSDGQTTELGADFSVGEVAQEQDGEVSPPDAPEIPLPEPLPAPPALPALANFAPLPEIPDLPAPATRSAPAPTPRTASGNPRKTARPTATGSRNSGKDDTGKSMAARLAAGNMPSPTYPAYSRRTGQTGTVVVQFTIDTKGRVVSASIYTSSKWELLDREAIRTVKTWKFPPGDVMTLVRPIVFQLR